MEIMASSTGGIISLTEGWEMADLSRTSRWNALVGKNPRRGGAGYEYAQEGLLCV